MLNSNKSITIVPSHCQMAGTNNKVNLRNKKLVEKCNFEIEIIVENPFEILDSIRISEMI